MDIENGMAIFTEDEQRIFGCGESANIDELDIDQLQAPYLAKERELQAMRAADDVLTQETNAAMLGVIQELRVARPIVKSVVARYDDYRFGLA